MKPILNPTISITKYGGGYSTRIEWREEAYLRLNDFDALVTFLKKEFRED